LVLLETACAVFVEKGFAAARMEDVAARAGIAKGTVYLHIAGQEALLKARITSVTAPPIGRMEAVLNGDSLSSADVLRRVLRIIRREILATDRRPVLRPLLTEAHNFPDLAGYYHDQVVARGSLACAPQLFMTPMVMAVLWDELFGGRAPLDVDRLFQAHLDMILHGLEAKP